MKASLSLSSMNLINSILFCTRNKSLHKNLIKPVLMGFSLCMTLFSCTTGPVISSQKEECVDLPFALKWNAPKPTADQDNIIKPTKGYKIYLKEEEDKVFSNFLDVGNVTEYKLDYLKRGKTYNIKVVAYNDNGDGRPSDTVNRKVCKK